MPEAIKREDTENLRGVRDYLSTGTRPGDLETRMLQIDAA